MKNLIATFAMLMVVGLASAQETPKSTNKAKSKTDTITTHRTTKSGVEKKTTTYQTDSTKSVSKKKHTNKAAKTGTAGKNNSSTRKDSLK